MSGLDYFERCFDLEGIINFFFGVHATLLSNIGSFHSFIFSNLYTGSRRIVRHVLGLVSIGWCSYRYGYCMLEQYTCSLTFAGRSYFTENGRRSGVIIYPNRLCNISGHMSARNTNEESFSIMSRSGNRSLVVAIACKYNFPRWRPKWRQSRYLYVSGHRSATKTNKESISIILRSENRSPVLAIAFKCNFPRWRPKWQPKHIFVCRSSWVRYKDE